MASYRGPNQTKEPTLLHVDFWGWLAYTIFALILISFLPEKLRLPLIGLIVLGGLVFMYNREGGLQGISGQLAQLKYIRGYDQ